MLLQIFWQFFRLGLVSFGGPAAHIGYFQRRFVTELKWLSQEDYGRTVALCQFLPGPASSQVGYAIGLNKAGVVGGIAAFLGFTLPSFLLMLLLVFVSTMETMVSYLPGLTHALKLLAVVVVADAVLSMSKTFCTRLETQLICLSVAALLVVSPSTATQIGALVICFVVGLMALKSDTEATETLVSGFRKRFFILFIALLVGLPLINTSSPLITLFSDFYQAGSLVFGGGHVVLPMLQESIGEQISADTFYMGYSAAQAVPGPMFTMATFLGASLGNEHWLVFAFVATIAIFLPGFLLVTAFNNVWQSLAKNTYISAGLSAVNAGVVGLLLATLWTPLISTTLIEPIDASIAVLGFALLRVLKIPIVALVALFCLLGLTFY